MDGSKETKRRQAKTSTGEVHNIFQVSLKESFELELSMEKRVKGNKGVGRRKGIVSSRGKKVSSGLMVICGV